MTIIVTGLPAPNKLDRVRARDLYCIPRSISTGAVATALIEAGHALPFSGAGSAYAAVELVIRQGEDIARHTASVTAFNPWRQIIKSELQERLSGLIMAISQPRGGFSDIQMDEPVIMGVVNVTPDSFSDGGNHASSDAAVAHAISLAESGAALLDIGGESTRPGASPVDPSIEQKRVIPVVRALAEKSFTVSIDTRNASTMAAALDVGAKIVNDVTALTGDPEAVAEVGKRGASVVLMHMQGNPQTMQVAPEYSNVLVDVFDFLDLRISACLSAGLEINQICVDPGIGFGKSDGGNLDLIDSLGLFQGLGCPVMIGASRKSFIGRLSGEETPTKRLAGSIAAAIAGVIGGAKILRVHDVKETRQALTVWRSLGLR
ncbi:MAG: dihydropteroate synthase [Rhodospirillaceae bacterium]|nr:dihydropteroate synthase [Rhodospirillaceae bacterium]